MFHHLFRIASIVMLLWAVYAFTVHAQPAYPPGDQTMTGCQWSVGGGGGQNTTVGSHNYLPNGCLTHYNCPDDDTYGTYNGLSIGYNNWSMQNALAYGRPLRFSTSTTNIPWAYQYKWYHSYWYWNQMQVGMAQCLEANLYKKVTGFAEERSYIMFELVKPLVTGKQYYFEVEIAAPAQMYTAYDSVTGIYDTLRYTRMDGIGACFVENLPATYAPYNSTVLDSLVPQITTAPGVAVNDSVQLLSGYITGNGERYLIVGQFHPADSIAFLDGIGLGTDRNAPYLFQMFKLFRPDCPNGTLWPSGAQATTFACFGDTADFTVGNPVNGPNWFIDGILQPDTAILYVPVGNHNSVISVTADTGACWDSTAYSLFSRTVQPMLPADTALFCNASMLLHPDSVLVLNADGLTTYVQWQGVDNPLVQYNNPGDFDLSVTQPGLYRIKLDYSGCTVYDTVHVMVSDSLPVDTLGNAFVVTEIFPEHCLNMNDGKILIHNLGYPVGLYYNWSTPDSLTDSIAADLAAGNYAVKIWDDSMRCANYAFSVPLQSDSCSNVSGYAFMDANMDCILNGTDLGLANVPVKAVPINTTAFTDSSGFFQMQLPPGNYVLHRVYPIGFTDNYCGDSASVDITAAGQNVNDLAIADTVNPMLQNVAVWSVYAPPFVTGDSNAVFVFVHNNGVDTEAVMLKVVSSNPNFSFDTAAVVGLQTVANDTLVIAVTVAPQQIATVALPYYLPFYPTWLDDSVVIDASIGINYPEADYTDNAYRHFGWVYSSYDPNDKRVNPPGQRVTHFTDTAERRFTYTVDFQNTGNFVAAQILVSDTLSDVYDLNTFQVLTSSHYMETYLIDNVASFFFPSIMLPDSNTDEPGSHGFLQFRVDALAAAGLGDTLANRAFIYFDQNPAVVTNYAINVYGIDTVTSVRAAYRPIDNVNLFPNPTGNEFRLTVTGLKGAATFYIEDGSGRRVLSGVIENGGTVETSQLHPGIYYVRLQIGNDWITKRFVKF